MAIEDELSRAEKALKDRLINAGKVAKDITNKAFKELVNTIEDYGRSLDQITDDLEKQLNLYSEIKFQAKGFGEALKQQLPYIKENKDLSQKLVGIYKEENKLLEYKSKIIQYAQKTTNSQNYSNNQDHNFNYRDNRRRNLREASILVDKDQNSFLETENEQIFSPIAWWL